MREKHVLLWLKDCAQGRLSSVAKEGAGKPCALRESGKSLVHGRPPLLVSTALKCSFQREGPRFALTPGLESGGIEKKAGEKPRATASVSTQRVRGDEGHLGNLGSLAART